MQRRGAQMGPAPRATWSSRETFGHARFRGVAEDENIDGRRVTSDSLRFELDEQPKLWGDSSDEASVMDIDQANEMGSLIEEYEDVTCRKHLGRADGYHAEEGMETFAYGAFPTVFPQDGECY